MSEKKPKKKEKKQSKKGNSKPKNDTGSKPKDNQSKKNNSKSKDSKSKKPSIRISDKKRKECKGDKECLTGVKSKLGINNIYSKKDGFGFFVQAPKISPFTQKDFKPKCGGLKKYKKYEDDNKPDSKSFGNLLPQLNKSLYFPKQKESECYFTGTKLKKKLELGKTCYSDDDCLTNSCSGIKLLRMPGKCVIKIPKNSGSSGNNCYKDSDCKKGLKCQIKKTKDKKDNKDKSSKNKLGKCVIIDRSVKEIKKKSIGDYDPTGLLKKIIPTKKKKKEVMSSRSYLSNLSSKGRSHVQKYSNKNKNKYIYDSVKKTNSKCQSISETTIKNNYIDNDEEYVSYKDKDLFGNYVKCSDMNCHKDCDKGSYCYKGNCWHINPICRFETKCLTDKYYKHKNCCKTKEYCRKQKIEGVEKSFCEKLDNIKGLNNGYYCIDNKNCKSKYCNKNLNKCMSKNYSELVCDDDNFCKNEQIYGNEHNACLKKKNKNICYSDERFPEKSRYDNENCIKDEQCKSNKCGGELTSVIDSFRDHKICRGTKNKKPKREDDKIGDLGKVFSNNLNKQNFEYIYFEDPNDKYSYKNDNNMVIFRNGEKYILGKLIIQKIKDNRDVYTILYFDMNNNVTDFKEALSYLNIITSKKKGSNEYYDYFSKDFVKMNKSDNIYFKEDWNKSNKSLKIKNKFIFDYICYKLFGNKKVLVYRNTLSNIYDSRVKYYQYNTEIRNFDKETIYDGNRLIYKSSKLDDIFLLSVPFSFDGTKILTIYKDKNFVNREIVNILSELERKEYYNLPPKSFRKCIFLGSFKFKQNGDNLVVETDSEVKNYINYNLSKVNYTNINYYSIFSDFI